MKSVFRNLFFASLLASLIVGAGMFSLPYIFAQTGFAFGIILLLFFVLVSAIIHKRYAEIIQKENGDKRFAALIEEYLGKRWKVPATITVITGIIFTLLVYLVLSGSFIRLIFPDIHSGGAMFLFWILGSVFVFMGISKYAFVDVLAFLGIAGIIFFIFINGIIHGNGVRLDNFSLSSAGLVFGPFLFSLAGRSAISSMWEEYKKEKGTKKNFLRSVILGTALPALLYVAFVYGITRLSENGVSMDAITGITLLPFNAGVLLGSLGILVLITSFIFLGLEVKGILKNDFKIPGIIAAAIATLAPFGFYFLGFTDFIKLVSLNGGVFLAIESLFIIMIYRKAIKKNNFIDFALIGVFLTAVILEMINFF